MKKIFFAMLTTLLVAGCAKENLVEPVGPQNGVTILTAGTPETKTVLQNDQKVLWTNGDKINVNGVESNELVLEVASATATFTIPGILAESKEAVFPASIYKDAKTVTLPAVQTCTENSFGATASPMSAYTASGNNLQFQHLCAVLKLNIAKGDDAHEIAYVEFSGKNNEKICGDFTIDYQNATLAPAVGMTFTEKKVRCNVAKTIPDTENLVVYVVVPAIQYANGYTVRVVDAQGHYMEKSKASSQTLTAGTVYDMPEFAFAPTDTNIEADIKITSAAEFVDFVQKYNKGEYSATCSVALMNNIVFDETTSTAFNATGGIAKDGNFEGSFYGNGKSIKNLSATCPLFYRQAAGVIQDLILDETTSFIFTLTDDDNIANKNLDVSSVVNIEAGGTVSNVEVRSEITLSDAKIYPGSGFTFNMGSVVGRLASGTIQNCIFSGNITVPATFQIGTSNGDTSEKLTLNLGGVCGATSSNYPTLSNLLSSGSIDCSAKILGYSHKVRVAGIIGYCQRPLNGEVNNKTMNMGDITVDLSSNAATSHTYMVAGVVGESNNANVNYAANSGKIEATSTKNSNATVNLAGIVGKISQGKSVTYCENSGEIYRNLAGNNHSFDPFMASTVYAEGKGYEDFVKNCVNTGYVHAN